MSSDDTNSRNTEWTCAIGQIGQIANLKARSDLNGSLARITGLDPSKHRYHVACSDGSNVSIKVENITVSECDVDDSSPHLLTTQLSADAAMRDALVPGAIVSLTQLSFPQIIINQPCRFVNAKNNDVVNYIVVVDCKSPLRVEFEGIKFVSSLMNAVILCGGSTVIFRHCSFTSIDACVASDANSTAYFDSCVFENSKGSGVLCEGVVIMRNCTCRQLGGFGVEVRNGGVLKAMSSQILNTGRSGVVGYKHANSIELVHCSVLNSNDSGVLIAEGCSGMIQNCDITNSSMAGVAIEQNGTAQVNACSISSCLYGVLAQTGRCKVTVKSCNIKKSRIYGVFVGEDCRGSVNLIDNNITMSKRKAINNDSVDSSCKVCVDGDVLTSSEGLLMSRPELRNMSENIRKSFEPYLPASQTYATVKARAKVGLTTVSCNGCGSEQGKVKFLVCGRCLGAWYCSKQCQKVHWKGGHKNECVQKNRYSCLLDPDRAL